jgi:hypothetical protein
MTFMPWKASSIKDFELELHLTGTNRLMLSQCLIYKGIDLASPNFNGFSLID